MVLALIQRWRKTPCYSHHVVLALMQPQWLTGRRTPCYSHRVVPPANDKTVPLNNSCCWCSSSCGFCLFVCIAPCPTWSLQPGAEVHSAAYRSFSLPLGISLSSALFVCLFACLSLSASVCLSLFSESLCLFLSLSLPYHLCLSACLSVSASLSLSL